MSQKYGKTWPMVQTCGRCRFYNPRTEDESICGYCEIMLSCDHSFEPIGQEPGAINTCDGFKIIKDKDDGRD